jgi:hypothetical protein
MKLRSAEEASVRPPWPIGRCLHVGEVSHCFGAASALRSVSTPASPASHSALIIPPICSMSRRLVTPGRSCLECRRRKIKCDRSLPCGYCVRVRNKCEYPSLPPSKNSESHHSINLASRVEHEHTLQPLHRPGPFQAQGVDALEASPNSTFGVNEHVLISFAGSPGRLPTPSIKPFAI